MKRLLVITLLLVVFVVIGCAAQPRSYFIEAKIYPLSVEEIEKMKETESESSSGKTPDFDKEIYNCELQISEVLDDGDNSETKNVICSPKLTFYKGQQANITISDDGNTSGVSADVKLEDVNGSDVANLDVSIKEKGKVVSRSKMKLMTTEK